MTRVLIVDDYKDWRRKVRQLLRERPELQVICEVSDGLEAVQKADELKPDLILLDIGLPKLNGIEAASTDTTALPQFQNNQPEPGQFPRGGSGRFEHRRSGVRL